MTRFLSILSVATIGALSFSAPAFADDTTADDITEPPLAQSEDDESEDEGDTDDALDDILNEEKREDSIEEERSALERGDIDDRTGVTGEDLLSEERGSEQKRVIKTIQHKNS